MRLTLNSLKSFFLFAALLGTTFPLHAVKKEINDEQEIEMVTNDENINCILYFFNPQESSELFFAEELVHFFDQQSGKTNFFSNLSQGTQDLLDNQVDLYGSGMLPPDGTYLLSPHQRKKMLDLPMDYLPVSVSVINTSNRTIKLEPQTYLGPLQKYRMNTTNILQTYPNLQEQNTNAQKRTRMYALGGFLWSIFGYYLMGKLRPTWGKTKKTLFKILAFAPTIVFTGSACIRYFSTDATAGELQGRYETLARGATSSYVQDMQSNSFYDVTTETNYTLPPQSILTELIFLDRRYFEDENSLSSLQNDAPVLSYTT